jgi:hypothetical protein
MLKCFHFNFNQIFILPALKGLSSLQIIIHKMKKLNEQFN